MGDQDLSDLMDRIGHMSGYDYYLMNLLDRIERGDKLSDQEQAAREALENGREALERSQKTLRQVNERLGDKK